jgi:hypothetical protein
MIFKKGLVIARKFNSSINESMRKFAIVSLLFLMGSFANAWETYLGNANEVDFSIQSQAVCFINSKVKDWTALASSADVLKYALTFGNTNENAEIAIRNHTLTLYKGPKLQVFIKYQIRDYCLIYIPAVNATLWACSSDISVYNPF